MHTIEFFRKNNHYIFFLVVFFVLSASCRKGEQRLEKQKNIISDKGGGLGNVRWTKDMDITLEGFVFVNEGQQLIIEAGTVVKFKTGQGATASALIVARGGKIIANGTSKEPIIFTSELDDLNGSLPKDTTGLWGGLIILGNAPLNTSNGEDFVEGIPISEPRALFGGDDPDDNSGKLSFISIRYAGTSLYEDNEINGLTLGGVGAKTIIQNVEVINCADDGIEVFGGRANLKNIVIVNANDDSFDFDMGYQGKVQFLLAIQKQIADNLLEGTGSEKSPTSKPITLPVFSNVTLIGNSGKNNLVKLDKYSGLKLFNSVLINKQQGINIEFIDEKTDCYAQWQNGNIKIQNNLFFDIAKNNTEQIFTLTNSANGESKKQWTNYFQKGNNKIFNLGIEITTQKINLIPDLPANDNIYIIDNEWFDKTNYKGAFGTFDWTEGWTVFKKHL